MITSLSNERLRWVRKLASDRKARRREGVWVAEGVRLAEEVLRSRAAVRLWLFDEDFERMGPRQALLREEVKKSEADSLFVKRGLLLELADTEHPQGVMAVLDAPQWSAGDVTAGPGPLLILDRLQDPGNLGTIVRTAEAAGACGLLLTPGAADPGSPKALRASAGSLLRVPVVREDDPVGLARRAEFRVIATADRGGLPHDETDLSGRFALLLGQEGSGVDHALAAAADLSVTISMAGEVESLNVAATAAVMLFEAARQRRGRAKAMRCGL